MSASRGLPSTFDPVPRSITLPPRDSVSSNAGNIAAKVARLVSVTGVVAPITSAPCSPQAAVQSAAPNFQSGKWLCTISKPGAIHSMHDSLADGSSDTGGGAYSLNTTSGSIRGCTKPLSGSVALPSAAKYTVWVHTCAHIGWYTP